MTSFYVTDANGTLYLAEHAGAWDSAIGDRSGVYYEDEARPADAVPLYRLIVVESAPLPALPTAKTVDELVALLPALARLVAAARKVRCGSADLIAAVRALDEEAS